jgi:hypothetical protein
MVNFPTSFDTDTTLYVAVNNRRTTLTSDINDSVTTIPVVATSGFPTTGLISILTGSDITQTEAISYTGLTTTTFSGAGRGADGTDPQEHNSGDNVDHTVVAAHHNEPRGAILALEHFVGISGSEIFATTLQDAYDRGNDGVIITTAGKAVVISGTGGLIVSGTLTAPTGTFSDSLSVSGTPVSLGVPDPLTIGTINAGTVAATTSLTISGTPVPLEGVSDPLVIGTVTATTSLTISGQPVITGTEFPAKGMASFTTPSVAGTGGTQSSTQTGFANRALVRKLVVTPSSPSLMTSTIIEFFKKNTFASVDLEYRATASGTFTDNDTWFHEDEDGGSGLHWKVTNNSATAGTYDFELTQEEFA